VAAWAAILAWTAAAWSYGRWQFGRSMRLEEAGVVSVARLPARPGSRREGLYRLPSKLLPDPLAAVVEKELRSLARSPRFRLLFLMGFSFSFLVFLPFLRRGASPIGRPEPYYLSGICCYALLLLGDVAFWNIFGQDRAAAQLYFLQPLQLRTVVAGKNIAAGIAVLLEVTGVVAVWAALRLPVSPGRIMEAYLAPAILCISFMAMGNLASVYFPRAVRSDKSTGAGSSGRFRVLLLPLLPVVSLPVLLAFAARYAFHSQFAFYALLGFAAVVNSAFYWFALQTALAKAEARKERLLEALSQSEGPLQLT
jgi:ABC-2 type transport system permease protein